MATTTVNPLKKNAVIMGRLTWESIPSEASPLAQCINIVLSTKPDILKKKVPADVIVCKNFDEAIRSIDTDLVERVWIVGGTAVYKEAMDHPWCRRIYLTAIQKYYECDTFFPEMNDYFSLLTDHGTEAELVPIEKQTEDGVDYYFRIYERIM